MVGYQSSQNQETVQCKYCKIQGLEWYKEGDKSRLRWVWDKVGHSREECDNVKDRKEGYSFAEVIQMHKNNAPKQDTTNQTTPPPKDIPVAGKNPIPQDYVTKELFESELNKLTLKLSEYINDFWQQNTKLFNIVSGIQEQFSNIPGYDEQVKNRIDSTFKTAKQEYEERSVPAKEQTKEQRKTEEEIKQ